MQPAQAALHVLPGVTVGACRGSEAFDADGFGFAEHGELVAGRLVVLDDGGVSGGQVGPANAGLPQLDDGGPCEVGASVLAQVAGEGDDESVGGVGREPLRNRSQLAGTDARRSMYSMLGVGAPGGMLGRITFSTQAW